MSPFIVNTTSNLVLTSLSGWALAKMTNCNPKLTVAIMLASTIARMIASYFIEKKHPCCTSSPKLRGIAINRQRHGKLHVAVPGTLAAGSLLAIKLAQNFSFNPWPIAGIYVYTTLTDVVVCKLSNRLTHRYANTKYERIF